MAIWELVFFLEVGVGGAEEAGNLGMVSWWGWVAGMWRLRGGVFWCPFF